ncbi:hypothetical protein N8071_00740 [bacterium]|nr:hypothetical protein [bacterium]
MLNQSTLIAAATVAHVSGAYFAFNRLTRASRIALLCLSASITGGVALADPAEGFCDGLDPSGDLFSTCIQAHAAANRVEHLADVGANATAIAKAEEALAVALETYAGLPGGGTVPGFEGPAPLILAVAYINLDGAPGYSSGGSDVLIAKITDEDESGDLTVDDMITTLNFPLDFAGSSEAVDHPLSVLITRIEKTVFVGDTLTEIEVEADYVAIDEVASTVIFRFASQATAIDGKSGAPFPNCAVDQYMETDSSIVGGRSFVQDYYELISGGCIGIRDVADAVFASVDSPSAPATATVLFAGVLTYQDFVDVDIAQ